MKHNAIRPSPPAFITPSPLIIHRPASLPQIRHHPKNPKWTCALPTHDQHTPHQTKVENGVQLPTLTTIPALVSFRTQLSTQLQSWLNTEWSHADLHAHHRRIAKVAANAVARKRIRGECDVGELLLAVGEVLEDRHGKNRLLDHVFVGPFDVANKISELLIVGTGRDVKSVMPLSREEVVRRLNELGKGVGIKSSTLNREKRDPEGVVGEDTPTPSSAPNPNMWFSLTNKLIFEKVALDILLGTISPKSLEYAMEQLGGRGSELSSRMFTADDGYVELSGDSRQWLEKELRGMSQSEERRIEEQIKAFNAIVLEDAKRSMTAMEKNWRSVVAKWILMKSIRLDTGLP